MRLCSTLCRPSRLAALRALVQREGMRQALREQADDEDGTDALVVAAAQSHISAVLDAVLAAGASINSHTIAHLLQGNYEEDGGLSALQLLQSRAMPAVPAEGPLEGWQEEQQAVRGDVAVHGDVGQALCFW